MFQKKEKEPYRISFRTNLQKWIISMRLRGKFNSKVFFLIFFREIGWKSNLNFYVQNSIYSLEILLHRLTKGFVIIDTRSII